LQVKILDTTLRDGEQTPGVSLTPEEKLRIALRLDDLGVDIIEAGSAITSEGEREALKRIAKEGLDAEVCSFARPIESDINAALECDVDSIHLVVPTSELHIKEKLRKPPSQVKEEALESVEYAKDHGLIVEFSAEDATRSNMQFLKGILKESISGV